LARLGGRDLPAELAALEVVDLGAVDLGAAEGDRAAVAVGLPRGGEHSLRRIELRRIEGRWVPVPLLDACHGLLEQIDGLQRAAAEPGGAPVFADFERFLDELLPALERLRGASDSAELAGMLQREFLRL